MDGANRMKAIVKKYESVSSQLVNFNKPLIYFSANVMDEQKEQIRGILGVRISNNSKKYLGLPTMLGKKKKNAFTNLKESFVKRIEGWSTRQLPMERKKIHKINFIVNFYLCNAMFLITRFFMPRVK